MTSAPLNLYSFEHGPNYSTWLGSRRVDDSFVSAPTRQDLAQQIGRRRFDEDVYYFLGRCIALVDIRGRKARPRCGRCERVFTPPRCCYSLFEV